MRRCAVLNTLWPSWRWYAAPGSALARLGSAAVRVRDSGI
jgi:hypothetical protein